MRIAIVGTGVSGPGLRPPAVPPARRHRCSRPTAGPGGHAHTVTVDLPDGSFDVDTGFLVYNERNYPGLVALFDDLGVATKPSDMSFSVTDEVSGLEWKGIVVRHRLRPAPQPGPPVLPADAGRHRPVQPDGPRPCWTGPPTPRVSLGDLLDRRPVVVAVPRLVPGTHGLVDLVGRPVHVPRHAGADLRPVLRQPRSARVRQPARLAHRRRRVPPLRRRHAGPARRGRPPRRAGRPRSPGPRTRWNSTPPTVPSASTRSWWPPTATRRSTCCPTPARPEREVLGAIRLPAQPGHPPHRRLAAADQPPGLGQLELPPPARPARRRRPSPTGSGASRGSTSPGRAAHHPQPRRRHRPGQGAAQLRLRPPGLRRRRHRRPAAPGGAQRCPAAPGSAAPTGATASTRTGSRAPGSCVAAWPARTCEHRRPGRRADHGSSRIAARAAQRRLRGAGRPPPAHPGRPPLHLPDRHGPPRPVRGGRRLPPAPAVERRGTQRRHASAGRDYLGDPSVPLDVAVRDLVEARTGARPTGPITHAHPAPHLGLALQPHHHLLLLRRRGGSTSRPSSSR